MGRSAERDERRDERDRDQDEGERQADPGIALDSLIEPHERCLRIGRGDGAQLPVRDVGERDKAGDTGGVRGQEAGPARPANADQVSRRVRRLARRWKRDQDLGRRGIVEHELGLDASSSLEQRRSRLAGEQRLERVGPRDGRAASRHREPDRAGRPVLRKLALHDVDARARGAGEEECQQGETDDSASHGR